MSCCLISVDDGLGPGISDQVQEVNNPLDHSMLCEDKNSRTGLGATSGAAGVSSSGHIIRFWIQHASPTWAVQPRVERLCPRGDLEGGYRCPLLVAALSTCLEGRADACMQLPPVVGWSARPTNFARSQNCWLVGETNQLNSVQLAALPRALPP